MNLTLTTYTIYGSITAFIILRVGWVLYKNGAHYLDDLLYPDIELSHTVNRLLLVGYYLVNLGYVAGTLAFLEKAENWTTLIEIVSKRTAFIVLSLAVLHYFNMAWVRWIKKFQTKNQYQGQQPK